MFFECSTDRCSEGRARRELFRRPWTGQAGVAEIVQVQLGAVYRLSRAVLCRLERVRPQGTTLVPGHHPRLGIRRNETLHVTSELCYHV